MIECPPSNSHKTTSAAPMVLG